MTRAAGALLLLTVFVHAQDQSCLKCHTDKAELEKARTKQDIPLERLLFDVKRFQRSVHATQSCSDCHFDYDDHPHGSDAETAKCAECHEKEAGEHDEDAPRLVRRFAALRVFAAGFHLRDEVLEFVLQQHVQLEVLAEGVEETAQFLGVKPEFFDLPHDVMLCSGWEQPARRVADWAETL